jgi:hypothetical protein
MPHPKGGQGNTFQVKHSFYQVCNFVGVNGRVFNSNTGEEILAIRGLAQDNKTITIIFNGEKNRHGNVCKACWGFRKNCSGTRVGHCAEALDNSF